MTLTIAVLASDRPHCLFASSTYNYTGDWLLRLLECAMFSYVQYFCRLRRREMASIHADSLSSDPSDCARPPPPKPHKPRRVKNNGNNKPPAPAHGKTNDFSSSEDEMRSTTSCGDDLESESIISELGELIRCKVIFTNSLLPQCACSC